MTPTKSRGAERNMGLSPPLLLSGSRTLREASATGGVESPFLFLLPCSLLPCLLLNLTLASLPDAARSLEFKIQKGI
ncbi:hypothetical protein [Nostoc sp. 'Peltigera membranacea cyanobiont' 210A]|uniref:hypothetical protein n=1 Tax=Nostoc sp. 'Peltigera membranacea cyanobiont' 210A TaxID=2014529 RepID=UPI0011806A85|nr:hypothetical protein [Nostoc sp. 'Peltigera membranacea cyanobiont' 210A]